MDVSSSSGGRQRRPDEGQGRSGVSSVLAPFHAELPAWAGRHTAAARLSSYSLWRTELGAGEMGMVWLHGIGGTHRYWTCAGPSLAALRRRSILLDLLGFGGSPRPWIRYTTAVHLAAVRRCLEGEKAPVVLVGHSLGAVLALAYAARYPEQVRALVLISLPNFGGERGAKEWFGARPGGWIYTNMWAMALCCVLTRRVAARLLPHLLRTIPRELAEDMVKHNMASWVTTLWEVLYRQDLATLADRLDRHIPVLLIHGDADATAPVGGVRQLMERRPDWKLMLLEGADHHPWLRQAADCLRTIEEWLDEQK